jgi:hypothetical protein
MSERDETLPYRQTDDLREAWAEADSLRAEVARLKDELTARHLELLSIMGQCSEEHYWGERLEERLVEERERCAVTVINQPWDSGVLAQVADAILELK